MTGEKKEKVPDSRSASRSAPPKIAPIENEGVKYEAPWSHRGVLLARDAKSDKELWRLKVVDYLVDQEFETDVQEVFISSMALSPDRSTLLITDEVGVRYAVDLSKRTFSIINWGAKVRLTEWRPSENGWTYSVEIKIHNKLTRELLLDGESVARRGKITNNLFKVTVDGKPVNYSGMMKDRSPPAPGEFIRLKPGETYTKNIELSNEYPVPTGNHDVTVAFEHTNHFSPDGFRMTSPVIKQRFEGDGYMITPKPKPE